jgi:diguanylate cyclase (GGDEF)-like protein
MKANTALAAFICALSQASSSPKRSESMRLTSQLLAVLVTVLSAAALLEYAFHAPLGLDTLLAADSLARQPGRMSPQTGTVLLLLGLVMYFVRARKGTASRFADLLLFCACLQILIVFSGYLFGAPRLFGLSTGDRTSPQTLLSLMSLAFVAFTQRAEHGVFSILLGVGIGGKIARIVTPFALLLPFVLEVGRASMIKFSRIDPLYAAAITTSLGGMLIFGLVVVMARRLEVMENMIRDQSLNDELTEVYNRRGFYLFAEQALRMAQRSHTSFSILFVDLDNLKWVNDSLGHDAGSAFISEVAGLLKATFRTTDIIGRLGGDEFAVGYESNEKTMDAAARRLEQATILLNARPGRQFQVSYSLGEVTIDANQAESLDGLLSRADKAMYKAKRRKKLLLCS